MSAKNWLDPKYIQRRMLREIDVNNTDTAHLIAALVNDRANIKSHLAIAVAALKEVVANVNLPDFEIAREALAEIEGSG